MIAVMGLRECLIGNYEQAVELDLSQRVGEQGSHAALFMGVTLWIQGLAEHHAAKAAQATGSGLQMQKRALSD
jgi:hypothetical protein